MAIRYCPKRIDILVAMAKKGYSQKELSRQSDVNQATISLFLNGQRSGVITPKTASKIAKALDCEVMELFDFQIDGVKQEV